MTIRYLYRQKKHIHYFVLGIFLFTSGCFYSYPEHSIIASDVQYNDSTKKYSLQNTYDLKIEKCEGKCNKRIEEIFNRVSEYYSIDRTLYLISINSYFAFSFPSGDIIISNYFIDNLSDNLITALLCHELSHSSYGHAYQKSFDRHMAKIIDNEVYISWKPGLGVSETVSSIFANKDASKAAQFIAGIMFSPERTYVNGKEQRDYIHHKDNIEILYLKTDVFPQHLEIQADTDAQRCLTNLGLSKHYMPLLLRKLISEARGYSQVDIDRVMQRISYMEKSL